MGGAPGVWQAARAIDAAASSGAGNRRLRGEAVTVHGEREGQDPRVHSIDDPTPTITASRGAGELVTPSLVEPVLRAVQDGDLDPDRVVLIDGVPYLLDIRFRMLRNPELARAMGFSDEQAEYEFAGNITEVTKQIGNAVPVHLAEALVGAVLGGAKEGERSQ